MRSIVWMSIFALTVTACEGEDPDILLPELEATEKSGYVPAPDRVFEGVYAIQVIRSTDSSHPVGSGSVGSVKATASVDPSSGWSASFEFDDNDYDFTSGFRVNSGRVKFPYSQQSLIKDGIDSCNGEGFAVTETQATKGVGTASGAEFYVGQRTRVEAISGLDYCDIDGPGQVEHVVKVAVAFDRPGTFCQAQTDCGDEQHCNASDECLPHPSCYLGGSCIRVCTGWCED